MFGRNLYETDERNSILEIRLTIYCPVFEGMKSFILNVADFLNLREAILFILMQVLFCIFAVHIQEQKIYDVHRKMVH